MSGPIVRSYGVPVTMTFSARRSLPTKQPRQRNRGPRSLPLKQSLTQKEANQVYQKGKAKK